MPLIALGILLPLILLSPSHPLAQEEDFRKAMGEIDRAIKAGGMEGRILWIDAIANMERTSSAEKIASILDKCARAKINTVVVDVKPITGEVLYDSSIAPRFSGYMGRGYPRNHDPLGIFVEEAHKRGILVHAGLNLFVEGFLDPGQGAILKHMDWQAIVYDKVRVVVAPDGSRYPISRFRWSNWRDNIFEIRRDLLPSLLLGNRSGEEVYLVAVFNGKVVWAGGSISVPASIPSSSSFLLGVGNGARWLKGRFAVGSKISISERRDFLPFGDYVESSRAVFVNPANPEVQNYELSLIKEVVTKYDVDGIVLDRARYPGLNTDFSDLSREMFEEFLGFKVERWPEDVLYLPGERIGIYGRLWMKWRAMVIRDFIARVASMLYEINPRIVLGVYVGAWYPVYYEYGVNWASSKVSGYDPFSLEEYRETGYAEFVDYICAGLYYGRVWKAGSPKKWESVEGGAELAKEVIAHSAFVYGGLYLLLYRNDKERFKEALKIVLSKLQGVMLFDLYYVEEYRWWGILEEVFGAPANPPHADMRLVEYVRKLHSPLP
jgi:hypothetical protein